MAITKQASMFMGAARRLWGGLRGAAGIAGKIGRPFAQAGQGIGSAGLTAANAAGRFAANNPRTALGIAGTGVYMGIEVPKRYRKWASYSDPNQHFYTPSPILKQLQFSGNNPQTQQFMQQQAKYHNRLY